MPLASDASLELEKGPEESVVLLESERLIDESVLLSDGVSTGVDNPRLRF